MITKTSLLCIVAFLIILFIISSYVICRKIITLKELRSLRLGRLSCLLALSLLISMNLLIAIFLMLMNFEKTMWIRIFGTEIVFFLLIIPVFIGITVPIVTIILTIIMWRRESKTIGNLILPIVLLLFLVVEWVYLSLGRLPDSWIGLKIIGLIHPTLSLYIAWQFWIFFLSCWVYGLMKKKQKSLYYVVLGAGLIEGEHVGKLLQSRIISAVNSATDEETCLVFSGGRGPDEKVSEAKAMQTYAVEILKFPIERTILEEQSTTTNENLRFSSRLLKDSFVFFTSDYHVFRTALFAASLKIEAHGGKGGKTALYYRVPAFIREFIAVLNFEKKKHMKFVGIIVGILILYSIICQLLYYIETCIDI